MNGLVIHKMTGSGNDFVFVDGRFTGPEDWTPDRIRAVCSRHHGVGADGLVIVAPGSRPGAVRFHFFNNDGQRASMCGNAALCATRIAGHFELAPTDGMVLETDAGNYQARCLPGPGERAELVLGSVEQISQPTVSLNAGEMDAHLVAVGVPHLVVRVKDLDRLSFQERGRALRSDSALGPAGANVNFVAKTRATPKGQPEWAMRTYERGVEGETLACGTGAVAVAAVLAGVGAAKLPLDIATRSGRRLAVAGEGHNGGIQNARLSGEGRILFRACLTASVFLPDRP